MPTPPPKITTVELYVSSRYRGWQEATLRALAANFDPIKRAFGQNVVEAVLKEVRASGDA